jgi:glutathione S-transferase
MTVTVHGWAFSPYVRAVRIALNEKGVAHDHRPLSPSDLATPEGRALSPFGRIPVFQHGDVRLHETPAILRYVDGAFPGPRLHAEDPLADSAASAYLYPTAVMGVFFNQAYVLANGGTPIDAAVAEAATAADPVLEAMDGLGAQLLAVTKGPWLHGETFGAADAVLAPMIQNLAMAEAGQALLARRLAISDWFARASQRPSLVATQAPVPNFGLPPGT